MLITIFLLYFDKKKYLDSFIFVSSFISTIILFSIRDINILLLRYYRGGADGLLHYDYGRNILENISNLNFYEALRGSENIFYFMPGLRYFSALNNIFFGETSYGYVLIAVFIPIIIFKIFEKLISTKFAIILFISFIFFPIFENMGFGHFNYVWQIARHHAETLSIFFILIAILSIISIFNDPKKNF